MQIELQVLALSALSFLLTVGADPIYWVKYYYNLTDFPVINCPKCFGFWLGIAVFMFQCTLPVTLLLASLVSVTSAIIEKILLPKE
jgi:hypothetical protein